MLKQQNSSLPCAHGWCYEYLISINTVTAFSLLGCRTVVLWGGRKGLWGGPLCYFTKLLLLTVPHFSGVVGLTLRGFLSQNEYCSVSLATLTCGIIALKQSPLRTRRLHYWVAILWFSADCRKQESSLWTRRRKCGFCPLHFTVNCWHGEVIQVALPKCWVVKWREARVKRTIVDAALVSCDDSIITW